MLFKKNLYFQSIALSAVLFFISVNGMEAEVKDWQGAVFSKGMVHDFMLPRLSLQSIGRFASVCKSFQIHSFVKVHPHLCKDSLCLKEFQDYKRCTEILRYISSTENRDLFKLVWKFDEKKREQELKDLYGLSSSISPDMAMHAYCNDYERLRKAFVKNEKEKLREGKKYREELGDALWWKKTDEVRVLLNDVDHIDAFDVISKNYISQHRVISGIIISDAEHTNIVFHLVCRHAYVDDVDIVWKLLGAYIMKNPAKAHRYLLKNDFRFTYLLAEKGLIDCNIADKYGKRALHYAVRCRHLHSINRLRQCGASVNVCNNLHRTPLHNACKLGFVDVIEALLKWDDIDVHIKDNKGKEPQDLLSKKNQIVKELFKQHDRKNNS